MSISKLGLQVFAAVSLSINLVAAAWAKIPAPVPFAVPHHYPAGPLGVAVKGGEALMNQTGTLARPYVGNGLSCSSCHIDAGRQPRAFPLVGVYARYPQYRTRNDAVQTMEERLDDCFERSMNGKALPADSVQMRDLVSYMAWISRGVPIGGMVRGGKMPRLAPPLQKPDIVRGQTLYAQNCAMCHGLDGAGVATFPAVWGPRSFNIGAGMAHLHNIAAFVRFQMPLTHPGSLSDQQAYDVAAFVLHHPRPDFPAKVHDWPHGGKPADTPY